MPSDDGIKTCQNCLFDIRLYPDGEWHLAWLIGDEQDDPCDHEPRTEAPDA